MTPSKSKAIKNRKVKVDFDHRQKMFNTYVERQARLKKLVELHGIDAVSQASDLSAKTIEQYVRVTNTPAISGEKIDKAELILEGL